ncbi:MAG: M23 family metallopeptidase [Chloroflexota bacterium]
MAITIGLAVSAIALAGCSAPQSRAASESSAGTATSQPAITASALPVATTTPAIVTSVDDLPTPAPPPQIPTAVATVTKIPTDVPSPTATSVTPTTTSTPTIPPPTFTPPAPPPREPGEHLILGRPVSADYPQWTDKAYPYASTGSGTLQPHHGVEFIVPTGTPILAVADGIVRVAGPDDAIAYGPQTNFYGNVVIIEHSPSLNNLPLFTVYGHLYQTCR